MRPRSPRVHLVLLAALAVAAFAVQIVGEASHDADNRFADLQVYVGAARALERGGSFYDFARVNGDVFTYPPAAGYLLLWTAWLPRLVTAVVWAGLTATALLVIACALARQLAPTPPTVATTPPTVAPASADRWAVILGVTLLLVVSSPGRSNISFGQLSVIVVALAVVDLLMLQESRWAGTLLGLAIAVKLTPLVFVPMLWLGHRRRQAVIATLTAATVSLLAWLLRPGQSWRYWTRELWDGDRFVNQWILGNQSLRASLERAGVPSSAVWVGLSAVILALSLTAGARLLDRGETLLAVGGVGACAIVVSPVSWAHHQFWLLACGLWGLSQPARALRAWALVVLVVMMAGPVDSALFMPARWILANAHLLVAASCLLVTLHEGRPTTPVGRDGRVRDAHRFRS